MVITQAPTIYLEVPDAAIGPTLGALKVLGTRGEGRDGARERAPGGPPRAIAKSGTV